MMSTSTIVAMSRKAARDSAREGKVPLIFEAEDLTSDEVVRAHTRGIPFIGSRIPRGWKHVKACDVPAFAATHCLVPWHDDGKFGPKSLVQVDSSGFGSPDEPALTADQWAKAVRAAGPGYAYAIVEAGQFQCVIGIFKSRAA